MSWLLRDGEVLAAIDGEGRGWPESIHGVLIKAAPVLAHSFNCGSGRELAWCARATTDSGEPCLRVRRVVVLGGRHIARVSLRGVVVVAERGAFERWNLRVGDRLEIRDT
ncbi:MAG: hypothetical protein M0Z30_03600 [Actinomycetota bacterium]|nr:hypothetical protein [Actinomycetota bacterium]